jgi:hypothetical protein
MTVNTTNIKSGPYAGNDVADQFSYTFKVFDKNDLIVYETDDSGVQTVLMVDTDYTVASIGVDGGGLITRLAGPLPTGYEWFIRSNFIAVQDTEFSSQGAFFPDVHEDQFDKSVLLIQQLNESLTRTLQFGVDYSGGLASLPTPVAGRYVRWNATEDGLENVDLAEVDPAVIALGDLTGQLDNYTAVRALTASYPFETIIVGGRSAVGDGGGGVFVKIAAGTDDDGTILDTGAGFVFKRLYDGAVHAKWFGISDDADYASAIQTMIDTGAAVVDFDGLSPRIDSQIVLRSNQVYQNLAGCDLSNAAINLTAFYGAGTVDASILFTGNTAFDDTNIPLASTTNLYAGDLVFIYDDQLWSAGSSQGEIKRVKAVNAGVSIDLYSPMDGQYKTASNAAIQKITPIENVTFRNFSPSGVGYPTSTESQTGLEIIYGFNITVESSCLFEDFADRHMRFIKSVNLSIKASTKGAERAGLGYGASFNCCENVLFEGNHENCRHASTCGSSDGVTRRITYSNVNGVGIKDAVLDSHAECDYLTISNVNSSHITDNASDDGITIQGGDTIINGANLANVIRYGVLIQPAVLPGMKKNLATYAVNDVIASGGSASGIALSSAITGAADIGGFTVSGGSMDGFGDWQLYINAETSSINNIYIGGGFFASTSGSKSAARIRTQNSETIDSIMLGNAKFARPNGTIAAVQILNGVAGAIANVIASGGVYQGGTYSISFDTTDGVFWA